MTDTELARQVRAGDKDAAQQLVDQHYEAVYRLQLRLTNILEDAEDLTQSTFATARQKIGSYRGGSTLRTWLHSIGLNEYRMWRRKQKLFGPLLKDRPMTESGYEEVEEAEVLKALLKRISEEHKEAFLLFEVEQHSMAEVSEILKVPLGTAKSRVAKARTSLRELLEEQTEVTRDELKERTS